MKPKGYYIDDQDGPQHLVSMIGAVILVLFFMAYIWMDIRFRRLADFLTPRGHFRSILFAAGIGSFVGYALAAAIFFGIMKMM